MYFLEHENEVKSCIEKFIARAERETGVKMKALRTDNGLEFINSELKIILERKGINHERSVVYTTQQNGRTEREMRTLVDAARSMIDEAQKVLGRSCKYSGIHIK